MYQEPCPQKDTANDHQRFYPPPRHYPSADQGKDTLQNERKICAVREKCFCMRCVDRSEGEEFGPQVLAKNRHSPDGKAVAHDKCQYRYRGNEPSIPPVRGRLIFLHIKRPRSPKTHLQRPG